jgi:hypothetical protein
MHRLTSLPLLIVFTLILLPASLSAQQTGGQQSQRGPQVGWSSFIRGGGVYQFDTDLDDGGNFDATRATIQAGHGYAWDDRTSVSLALGYSYDGYSFSGETGIAAVAPWENINTFSLSLPMRWGIADNWSAFLIPSIRSTGESSANFDDTITGGGFFGAAYRFGERLTIGPGIGVISQLEDNATIFPILIIDWKITDRLSLDTGRGLGATLGPGLALNYRANQSWNFTFGGRYESLRFRLDKNAIVPNGIGEDKTFPVYAGCTYYISPKTNVSFIAGVELGGELKLEDRDGNRLRKESYDPGGFLGLTFSMRL